MHIYSYYLCLCWMFKNVSYQVYSHMNDYCWLVIGIQCQNWIKSYLFIWRIFYNFSRTKLKYMMSTEICQLNFIYFHETRCVALWMSDSGEFKGVTSNKRYLIKRMTKMWRRNNQYFDPVTLDPCKNDFYNDLHSVYRYRWACLAGSR